MKTATLIFAAAAVLMLVALVWPENSETPCRRSCEADSRNFKTAEDFRRCIDGCQQ